MRMVQNAFRAVEPHSYPDSGRLLNGCPRAVKQGPDLPQWMLPLMGSWKMAWISFVVCRGSPRRPPGGAATTGHARRAGADASFFAEAAVPMCQCYSRMAVLPPTLDGVHQALQAVVRAGGCKSDSRVPRTRREETRHELTEEKTMATFISLINFTDQGIRNVKDSPERLNAFRALAEKLGVSIKGTYYTVGHYDMVVVVEGSDEAATTVLLAAGSLGNVRSQTLRAFSQDEMKKIISKMP